MRDQIAPLLLSLGLLAFHAQAFAQNQRTIDIVTDAAADTNAGPAADTSQEHSNSQSIKKDKSKNLLPSKENVARFFKAYCVECHSESLAEGNLDLAALSMDFANTANAQKWIEVLDRINLGEMPPPDETQPAPIEVELVVSWLTDAIRNGQARASRSGGRVVLRRMTRLEYARTVSDLFSLKFIDGQGPLSKLPPDGAISGFDRHWKSLMIDPSLMDAYYSVAEQIAEQAILFEPPLIPEKTLRFDFRDTRDSAMKYLLNHRSAYLEDGKMVIMEGNARTYGMLRHPFGDREIPETGRYRIRVRAGATTGKDESPVYMRIKQGADNSIAQFKVSASPENMQIYETIVTRSDQLQGEFGVAIVDGTKFKNYVHYRGRSVQRADKAFEKGDIESSLRIKARMRAQGDFDTSIRERYRREVESIDHLPKLYLDYIEVTGPLRSPFPPPSMKLLFPNGWDGAFSASNSVPEKQIPFPQTNRATAIDLARTAFARLLPLAYRRPTTSIENEEIFGLVASELADGQSFEQAMKTGIVAVLCSPHFLFLGEPLQPSPHPIAREQKGRPAGSTTIERVLTPFELASRMSYFLWSSKPDEALLQAALNQRLSDKSDLSAQVERMLSSARIEGFLDGFVRQWLRTEEFSRFKPDERIFPRYHETQYAGIEDDFAAQPIEMIRTILSEDRPITDLIDSDWTMLNQRLARYYGLPDVTGDRFQLVQLNGRDAAIRGGLLGMAGLHRWGSDGNRTKPVERGKYILDVLFNDPPPPPPPNAGEVEPNLRGQRLTVRQRLQKHREQTTCNHCHRRIDPYGLAFENFNTVGLWRELEDGERPLDHWGDDRPPINTSGRLMTGDEFDNFFEFKSAMKRQKDRFLRGLTEKLLAYALARSIEPKDRMLIDAIVERSKSQNDSLRVILSSIVLSRSFRMK